ncbi:MAG TPA: hypothetical protein VHR27_09265, partial [Blastocatellia bacterium]|nr:hypothetical protein [Blastocatellia bacterium]
MKRRSLDYGNQTFDGAKFTTSCEFTINLSFLLYCGYAHNNTTATCSRRQFGATADFGLAGLGSG